MSMPSKASSTFTWNMSGDLNKQALLFSPVKPPAGEWGWWDKVYKVYKVYKTVGPVATSINKYIKT